MRRDFDLLIVVRVTDTYGIDCALWYVQYGYIGVRRFSPTKENNRCGLQSQASWSKYNQNAVNVRVIFNFAHYLTLDNPTHDW